jgi:DNA helicase II / ATP-dependent DNA helicase PcrA
LDKTVTLAVAGSGKTDSIVKRLDLSHRTLILTYTNNAHDDLRRRVIKTFGFLPDNVTLDTYFSFLRRFCYSPYLSSTVRDRGISYSHPSKLSSRFNANQLQRYVDGTRRLYHCRLAKLIQVRGIGRKIVSRIERYYDQVFVDEAQDFGGHDFNLLMELARASVEWSLVGDFYQYTYSTSHDGNVNKSLHHDYDKYRQRLSSCGFHVDTTSLVASHRCSATVCEFINAHLGIHISPAVNRVSVVMICESEHTAETLYNDSSVVKLFLREHDLYRCNSMNWGASKGLDHFSNVCVALNAATWKLFKQGRTRELPPMTRNKLYVAASRARNNLYIVPEILFRHFRA